MQGKILTDFKSQRTKVYDYIATRYEIQHIILLQWLVLMTAIATKHCTHDAGSRQFGPCVFIMSDL